MYTVIQNCCAFCPIYAVHRALGVSDLEHGRLCFGFDLTLLLLIYSSYIVDIYRAWPAPLGVNETQRKDARNQINKIKAYSMSFNGSLLLTFICT